MHLTYAPNMLISHIKYLLRTYYVPSTILDTGDIWRAREMYSTSHKAVGHIWGGRQINNKDKG